MKIDESTWFESDDGREDIVLMEGDVMLITITQEMYRFYGISYAEMKTQAGVAAFFMFMSIQMAKAIK